ncbi:MAG: NUDIX hydrolase [Chitinispirillaceae bacterium]|nr:NUDIX hydrolase [Chitinispirillaceae bacterium]
MNEETSSFKISSWKETVESAGCRVNDITTLQKINKRSGAPLFSLLDVSVTSPDGKPLPNIVFIRGHAVVVVPLLINNTTGEERFLMVRQHRVGNGTLTLEFPAGMLDHESDMPIAVARKELFEETGLNIEENQLTPLWPTPLYSSAGASDEAIYYFGCKIRVEENEFNAFENRYRENSGEHEFITAVLLTRREAEPQINSIQALLGFHLFYYNFV